MYGDQRDHGGGPNGTMGAAAMSELDGVKTIKQSRVDDQPLAHEERLRIAKHIVQAMQSVGVDCALAKAPSAH